MNSKQSFFAILFAVTVISTGLGCSSAPTGRNTTQAVTSTQISVSPLTGTWLFTGPSDYGGTDGFDLELAINGTMASGTFSSVLNRVNPAVRIDTGTVTGTYDPFSGSIAGIWKGDRSDAGTVTMKFNPQTKQLDWQSTVRASGEDFAPEDYSIPKKMLLVKNSVNDLSVEERKQIVDTTTAYANKKSTIKKFTVSVAQVVGISQSTFVLAEVIADESEEADVVYVYLKRSGTGWTAILGPATQIDHTNLRFQGIPEVMWMD